MSTRDADQFLWVRLEAVARDVLACTKTQHAQDQVHPVIALLIWHTW